MDRSFLCMHRKLISEHLTLCFLIRRLTGMPEMKATSLPDCEARMPTCQSAFQPGDLSALSPRQCRHLERQRQSEAVRCYRPVQKRAGVVEAEHGVVVFDVVIAQEAVDLLQL